MPALELLRSARRVGFVFSGGSSRCAFQVGAVETLAELGVEPALCVGVSGGAWNAAAVAAGTAHRLRYYWRAFVRMPHRDVRNLWREQSPYIYRELHRRTFGRYVGAERLRRPEALPLWIAVTRLRDFESVLVDVRAVDDPLELLLASNFLPPYYTHPPRIDGERYVDGAVSDNLPYEKAFAEGCDAVVVLAVRAESEGGLAKSALDPDHRIPEPFRRRTVVVRPRFPLAAAFAERRWPVVARLMDDGRRRAREVLTGEPPLPPPAPDPRPGDRRPTAALAAAALARAVRRRASRRLGRDRRSPPGA
jgi:predicted acylesterase/phospholipase RssA